MSDLETGTLVLEPGRAELRYWRDLWIYRELFFVLAARDISVRYKQTVLGVAWAVLRPLVTVVVFTMLFRDIAKLPSTGEIPYSVTVLAGMLPWFLFSGILSEASASLISNSNLISKVYFPRLIIPTSSAAVALVDFSIALMLTFSFLAWHGIAPTWRTMFLPAYVLLTLGASLGPAYLMTALNVKYRDFRYIVPFLLQFGLYISPVGYSTSVIPESWAHWYRLNPLVGIIEGFRWSLLGGESALNPESLLTCVLVVAVFLWIGIRHFRRTEKSFFRPNLSGAR